jgi:hypothetical protein
MRRFVLGWKMLGLEQSLGSRIVTYADDLVILCRRGKAEEALQQLRKIMSRLKPSRNRQQGVSGTRQLHSDAVAPVVAVQAQKPGVARAGPIHPRIFTGTLGSYA